MEDADGSSVRSKVAQYFVDKQLQELKHKNPHFKLEPDDLEYLQALPPFDEPEHGETPSLTREATSELPPELPPLFPTPADVSSWEQLLDRFPKLPSEPGFPPKPKFPRRKPVWPWYRVAIIGAGVAGLRTAKLLQDRGIPYKIFEASDRPGGRIFTYQFPSSSGNPQGNHDYYDVGAMRFPNNDASKSTFKLFHELGLSSKLINYVMSIDENIRYYNSECRICMGYSRALKDAV